MDTRRLRASDPGSVEAAADRIMNGEVVAVPTDTVYGIAAHGLMPESVGKLYVIKERPTDLPIPLLLPDAASVERVCVDVPAEAWALARCFWPGGLSLVLRRADIVPDEVTCGAETVAVRVPNHPLIRRLCLLVGAPLAATSANLHGKAPPATADDAWLQLGGRIPLLVDGGACSGGRASTVLDLTVSPPTIRRLGPVSARQLERAVALW